MEEWDLRRLEKWAEAAEITLPVSQWQRVGEESGEESDSLSSQLNAVREQIQERLKRAIRNRPPADMIARIATREFEEADREAFRRAAGRSLDGALLARPRPGNLAAPGDR